MPHDTAMPVLGQRRLSAGAALRTVPRPGDAGSPGRARSLYIHIPFCFHKCHYCDFYSLVDTRDRQEPFVLRLERELAALAPWASGGPLDTIFVGGGTPSLLRVDLWERLLAALSGLFDLSAMGGGHGEFTVECNPETVTPALMATLAGGGVNRVSIGAQSFDPRHLKTLERWHDPENVGRAVELARSAGIARQSVDLIFAIPGQTLDDWSADLGRALALGTTHVSCYSLTYEPGTAMTARLKRGEFPRADEDLEVEMHRLTLARLRAAGLERYEVSNYARPGDEARHNLAYWRQEQWLAAGPAASAHVGGHRWKNIPRLDDYLGLDDGGFAPITDHEPPDARRALAERIMTGLRLAEGLDSAAILAAAAALAPDEGATARGVLAAQQCATGDPHRCAEDGERWHPSSAPARLLAAVSTHAARGHLQPSPGRWRLTDAGFLFADGIAADLMAALD
ncbi:MAG: radical SAM family heme chaperone HemW [Phycisphaerales bacterium]